MLTPPPLGPTFQCSKIPKFQKNPVNFFGNSKIPKVRNSKKIQSIFWNSNNQFPFGILEFWILEFWNFGILEFWNFGISEFWNFGILEFGNLGILEFRKFGILEFRNFGILELYNFGILEFPKN